MLWDRQSFPDLRESRNQQQLEVMLKIVWPLLCHMRKRHKSTETFFYYTISQMCSSQGLIWIILYIIQWLTWGREFLINQITWHPTNLLSSLRHAVPNRAYTPVRCYRNRCGSSRTILGLCMQQLSINTHLMLCLLHIRVWVQLSWLALGGNKLRFCLRCSSFCTKALLLVHGGVGIKETVRRYGLLWSGSVIRCPCIIGRRFLEVPVVLIS